MIIDPEKAAIPEPEVPQGRPEVEEITKPTYTGICARKAQASTQDERSAVHEEICALGEALDEMPLLTPPAAWKERAIISCLACLVLAAFLGQLVLYS